MLEVGPDTLGERGDAVHDGVSLLQELRIIAAGRLLFSFVRRLPLPRADEGSTRACGQALDKARGRKPRNEARLFSRGSALWAFERRPIAQVRDVRGAAPGAACCVKALPALGCAGEVRAARLVM